MFFVGLGIGIVIGGVAVAIGFMAYIAKGMSEPS
jgi:hypothetical protein